MIFRFLMIFFTLFTSILSAKTIDISSIKEPTNILKKVDVYIDKENTNNFEYVQNNSSKIFKQNDTEQIHLGYSTDAIWIKFKLHNSSNKKVRKVLEISNLMVDDIFLYTKEANTTYSKKELGALHNKTFTENILTYYFNISLNANETKEYYLKVASLSCAVYFKANLMSKDQLYKKEISHQLSLTLFFGSIFSLILYNLFIYFFTRDSAYLYYVLYMFFTTLNHLSFTTLSIYFVPPNLWELDVYSAIFYLSFTSIFAILFTMQFLNTKKYKKIHFIFKIFLFLNIVFLLFTSEKFYPLDIVSAITFLSLMYVVYVSFYLLYKKEANAKYIVLGWSIAIFGWLMLANHEAGFWNLIDEYHYFYETTIFLEAILFSVALANKLNTTKELERSVATNEVLTRELHHRVKNNMQFIISIYRLKLAKYSDYSISESLKEVEGTIQAMSATHEMLYSQKVAQNIDAKEYFTTLIEKLQHSYSSSNIAINLDVTTDLNIDSSIYVGIILNELITNSFKYAFDSKDGEINISLSKDNTKYKLLIEDNGIGFDSTKESDTFGIELVQTLVEDELGGRMSIDTSYGTKFTIEW